jgi:coenzyme F420-reducing hydrogenase beta subunit
MPEIEKIEKIEKKDCTGCAACKNVCPQGCISFQYDMEGFLYPAIIEGCKNCGLCDQVCPIINEKTQGKIDFEQFVVAAVSNDAKTREASSSGGAFTEICNAFGDENTVVFGARFDKLKVVHDFVIGTENIGAFRKSKYVQSEIGDTFSDAKKFLEKGNKVVFSGTPCQIAGLRSYLGKNYENLLCIDFICHGVGSPGFFETCLNYLERKFKSKIIRFSFRNQIVRFGNRQDFVCRYDFENDKLVFENNDTYQRFFLSQLCLRPSCGENCKFRHSERLGDITLGDFKGKFSIFPRMIDSRNYSTIVVNTQKGNQVFQELNNKMKLIPFEFSQLEKFNPLFFKTTKQNSKRDVFFQSYAKGAGIERLMDEFLDVRKPHKKLGKLKGFIPFYAKRVVQIALNEVVKLKKSAVK